MHKIKWSPLVGLALAVAGGYVLAHFVIKTVEYIYENFPNAVYNAVCVVVGTSVVAGSVLWLSKRVRGWVSLHRKAVAFSGVAAVVVLFVLLQVRDNLTHEAQERAFQEQLTQQWQRQAQVEKEAENARVAQAAEEQKKFVELMRKASSR